MASSEDRGSYHLPDLVALCGDSFELRTNPHCRAATEASLHWASMHGLFDDNMKDFAPRFQWGLLAALCFPTCDYPQLELIMDCLLYAVNSELLPGPAYEDIWTRLQRTTSSAWQDHFQLNLRALRDALLSDTTPDMNLDQWMEYKRKASGFLLCLTFIDYACDLDIQEQMQKSTLLQELTRHTTDILELASYNVRQARDDDTSLVTILSRRRNLSIQDAINAAAEEAKSAVSSFLAAEAKFLQDGSEANASARRYVQGLRDWIIGTAHWVYETDVHFLGRGEDVKALGWVFILPKSDVDPIERYISELKESSNNT
ncbi:hypothetical protein NM688_g7618 [Phlebia brevispora]|uniref:Uncharacterized protein n=1 Tax=Phlebia brevispora TaxID=194682 RepID=A0ACC1S360_9APHY|nr:hypothetical protein NM688_g7618 [Phlebia brevispora]